MTEEACPIDGCPTPKPDGHIMCREHWLKVPVDLRQDIYACVKAIRRLQKAEEAAPALGKVEAAQKVLDEFDRWDELRDTAVGEVEMQEAEA